MSAMFACALIILSPGRAASQELVEISLPALVTFSVTDVSTSSAGSLAPTTIDFSGATLLIGHALRISVRAESADFSPPSGTAIPASRVSWTASNAIGGTGFNGTLSSTGYTIVYQSQPIVLLPISGSVDLDWTLAASGTPLRAGDHTITLRWKLESVVP